MIKRFSKEYPVIVKSSIISCVVIICYALYEKKLQNCTIAVILFQLAIGIIINSLFFFTQIYLAQKKQQEYADKCIRNRIISIQSEMREIFERLRDLYLNEEEKTEAIDEKQLVIILQRTVSTDYVHLIDPTKYGRVCPAEFTVSEFIIQKVKKVEMEIDRLCTYYSQRISPELMEVLELILNSTMHNNMARSLLQSANGVSFGKCNQDIFFMPYYELIRKLDDMKILYE